MALPLYPHKRFLKDMWFILGEYRYSFLFWYCLRLLSSVIVLVIPYAVAKIIDFFTAFNKGDPLNEFYFWLGVIFFASLSATIIRLTSKFYLGDLGRKAQVKARLTSLSSLLKYSLGWHEKENAGNKVQRINNGSNGIRIFVRFLSQSSTDIITGIIGVAIVFTSLSWKFTLILILYIICYLSFENFMNKKIAKRVHKVKSYSEKVSGKLHEYSANIATVKSLGLSNALHKKAEKFENKLGLLQRAANLLGNRKWIGIQSISDLFYLILLLVVGFDIMQGRISVGFFVLFLDYIRRTRSALNNITNEFDNVIDAKYSIYSMVPFLHAEEVEKDGRKKFPSEWKKFIFKDIAFSYGKKKILKNLNFTIKKGDKIGLVGGSGQGKSTIFKLLLNLYAPTEGRITVDGVILSKFSRKSLTNLVSVVPQEVELFNISLEENITLGSRRKDSKRLQQALEIADCSQIVERLPEGIKTLVGEKGVKLSGGEKQRIGIARAIYADPDFLLFDESTSHLDSETEKRIQKNIHKKLRAKTALVIAHRLSILRDVDKIIVLDKGKIVEQGTFTQLIKKKGKFWKLYKLQKSE